ncbi:hypothetical protein HYV11_02690 [Candidatus Dependentiae bacterium]|nr:hypothetical protein [Candidatus Dependentiae bacterium]
MKKFDNINIGQSITLHKKIILYIINSFDDFYNFILIDGIDDHMEQFRRGKIYKRKSTDIKNIIQKLYRFGI